MDLYKVCVGEGVMVHKELSVKYFWSSDLLKTQLHSWTHMISGVSFKECVPVAGHVRENTVGKMLTIV